MLKINQPCTVPYTTSKVINTIDNTWRYLPKTEGQERIAGRIVSIGNNTIAVAILADPNFVVLYAPVEVKTY